MLLFTKLFEKYLKCKIDLSETKIYILVVLLQDGKSSLKSYFRYEMIRCRNEVLDSVFLCHVTYLNFVKLISEGKKRFI